jgi:hypothetical protein
MIPLGYQLVEQKKRLNKVEEIERTKKRSFANSAASAIHRASIPLRPSQINEEEIFIEMRGGFCYNIREIFRFKASTQDQLKEFLQSESNRLSTFIHKNDELKYKREIQANSSPIQ